AIDLLVQARRRGVEVFLDGERLRYRAPQGALTAELRDALRQRKSDLFGLLRVPHDQSQEPFAVLDDLCLRVVPLWRRRLDERRGLRDRLEAAEDQLNVEAVRDTLEAIIAAFPSSAPVIELGETSSVDGVPCHVCGCQAWWLSIYGGVVCGHCHAPPT